MTVNESKKQYEYFYTDDITDEYRQWILKYSKTHMSPPPDGWQVAKDMEEDLLKIKSDNENLKKALLKMCEYANYLGLIISRDYKNGNYVGDFVKQYDELLTL